MRMTRPNTNELAAIAIRPAPDPCSLLAVEEVAEMLHVPPSRVYERTQRRAAKKV
jgi:hypothetical protein